MALDIYLIYNLWFYEKRQWWNGKEYKKLHLRKGIVLKYQKKNLNIYNECSFHVLYLNAYRAFGPVCVFPVYGSDLFLQRVLHLQTSFHSFVF